MGRFLAEGQKVTGEALRMGLPCHSLLFSESLTEEDHQGLEAVLPPEMSGLISSLPEKEFATLCGTVTPQGLLAEFDQPKSPPLLEMSEKDPLLLILDEVRDPGNLGTAIRCAAALGASGVILTKGCADLWNPKTVRATAGSVFRIPVWAGVPGADVGKELCDRGFAVWVSSPAGEPLTGKPRPPQLAIVAGNESRGAGDAWQKLPGARKVSVPMRRGVESLNVGTAVAAILAIVGSSR
jgi:TrmH family RNA methyltransferase